MNLLIINGSPKAERSHTMHITNAFVRGFGEDARVETVELYRSDIKPCTGCFYCWKSGTGKCAISDDVRRIHSKITAADVIIFSFPLYFFGVPSRFMQRLPFASMT